MSLDGRMIWVDIETFGLSPENDPILELGFKITDLDLNTIDDFQTEIWDTPYYDQRFAKMQGTPDDQYVLEMHTKSELFEKAQNFGASTILAEQEAMDWLEGHGVNQGKEPLCGSSVHFDRSHLAYHMPSLLSRFHYRIVDNSSLKVLCQTFAPEIYEKLPPKKEWHRVLPDLDDTVEEFRFYLDNFIWDTRD